MPVPWKLKKVHDKNLSGNYINVFNVQETFDYKVLKREAVVS